MRVTIMDYDLKLKMTALLMFLFFTVAADVAVSSEAASGINILAGAAMPYNEHSLDMLIDAKAGADYVLLGEASHGTSEFYSARALITRRLVEEKGFSVIAIEGDWTSVYRINKYIKGAKYSDANVREIVKETFTRWAPWMWGNEEFAELVRWLRQYNKGVAEEKKVGIYGMDIYGYKDSIDEVINFISRALPNQKENIKKLYDPFKEYAGDPGTYIRRAAHTGQDESASLKNAVGLLEDNREKAVSNSSEKEYFNALRNARVIISAEAFYRKMIYRDERSWNARAQNFTDTVRELSEFYGGAKVIGWAHNTHVGDARATSMALQKQKNIGQMLREKFPEEPEKVYITGFGTYRGTVAAGRSWGTELEIMNVPQSPEGTAEFLMNEASGQKNVLFFMKDLVGYEEFNKPIGHRAMGIVYNPETEYPGNYVPTILTARYNAFIFFPETSALTPVEF